MTPEGAKRPLAFLRARQAVEELQRALVPGEGCSVPSDEIRFQPRRRVASGLAAGKPLRQERRASLNDQIENRCSFSKCPLLKLSKKELELRRCQIVGELGDGCWHPAQDLVTAEPRQQNAIPLAKQPVAECFCRAIVSICFVWS